MVEMSELKQGLHNLVFALKPSRLTLLQEWEGRRAAERQVALCRELLPSVHISSVVCPKWRVLWT